MCNYEVEGWQVGRGKDIFEEKTNTSSSWKPFDLYIKKLDSTTNV